MDKSIAVEMVNKKQNKKKGARLFIFRWRRKTGRKSIPPLPLSPRVNVISLPTQLLQRGCGSLMSNNDDDSFVNLQPAAVIVCSVRPGKLYVIFLRFYVRGAHAYIYGRISG